MFCGLREKRVPSRCQRVAALGFSRVRVLEITERRASCSCRKIPRVEYVLKSTHFQSTNEISTSSGFFILMKRSNRSTMSNRLRELAGLLALILASTVTVTAFPRASETKPWKNRRTEPDITVNSDLNRNAAIFPEEGGKMRLRVAPRTGSSTALLASFKFKNFEDMLESFHEEPVLVAFTSIHCGPCKLQKKELQTASKMVGEGFKMFAIDTEKWPHVGQKFKVGILPCLVVVKHGQEIVRLEGLTKAEEVVAHLENLL